MARFVDYDPTRAVATYEDKTQEGALQVHYRQDCEPVLEHAKMLRDNGIADLGIKRDMWHYAQIPPVVMMKWKFELGVDLFNKDHLPAVLRLLNTDYKYLKNTTKNHMVKQ